MHFHLNNLKVLHENQQQKQKTLTKAQRSQRQLGGHRIAKNEISM